MNHVALCSVSAERKGRSGSRCIQSVALPSPNRVWIFIVVLWCLTASFQRAGAEDLVQIYELALENDPAYQAQVYEYEAVPENLNQAYAGLLPLVTADGLFQRTKQEIVTTEVAVYGEGTSRYPEKIYNLTLKQPLFDYAAFMLVSQAKEEVIRSRIEFDAAGQDLIFRVAEAYVRALSAKDNLFLTWKEETAVRRHFELARVRYQAGLAPVTDFYDAKARLANVTTLRVRAENALADALQALTEITGRRIDDIAELGTEPVSEVDYRGKPGSREGLSPIAPKQGMPLLSPEPKEVEDWIRAAEEHNLLVESQRRTVAIAEKEITRQRSGHLPTVEGVVRWNRDDQNGSLFGGGSDIKTRDAYILLNVPIFQGFSVMSKTREATVLHKASQQELERQIRFARREAKASFMEVEAAIKNAEALKQSVISNRMALESKREGFNSGLFPSLAVLDAERDYHQAMMDYALANYTYIINSLRLKRAVGSLNPEDIAGINKWIR